MLKNILNYDLSEKISKSNVKNTFDDDSIEFNLVDEKLPGDIEEITKESDLISDLDDVNTKEKSITVDGI